VGVATANGVGAGNDVGAGAAPWSLTFAALSPNVRVTALDLPAQLPALSEAVETAGLRGQFEIVEADIFSQDLSGLGTFDVAIVANVCHLFPADRNRTLLGIVATSLAHGGTLAIIDQVLDVEPDWGRWSALYAVGALHSAPGGRLYPLTTYAQWFRDAGCCDFSASRVSSLPPLTLMSGRTVPCP